MMNKTLFQLIFIVFLLLFLLAIVNIFDTIEGYNENGVGTPISAIPISTPISLAPITTPVASPITNYDPSNYNVEYHASAEDIQAQLDIDMSANLISVRDASGNIVKKPVSQTASDTTYYTSGTLKYKPANYVPDYEDTVYFSKLTGLGYQSPVVDTNSQLSGFCKHDRYFPDNLEKKCGELDSSTCASTTCCILMGGKCMAGNYKGPYFKAHYSDIDLSNKDKYYYMGRCYGNCIDDQSNMYDYGITRQSYGQTLPGFSDDNPAYLPNLSDYLSVIAPSSFTSVTAHPPIVGTSSPVPAPAPAVALNSRRFVMGQSPITSSTVMTLEDENGTPSSVPFVIFKGLTPITTTPISLPITTPSPAASIPSSIFSAAPISTTPISTTPISITPISTTPISTTPISTTPISTTPISTTPISTTPISTFTTPSISTTPITKI